MTYIIIGAAAIAYVCMAHPEWITNHLYHVWLDLTK